MLDGEPGVSREQSPSNAGTQAPPDSADSFAIVEARISPPHTTPWGTPYVPGAPAPAHPLIAEGTYKLRGAKSGIARVTIAQSPDHRVVQKIEVAYDNYSDDRESVINGTESVSGGYVTPTTVSLDWRSNLVQSGEVNGAKTTSPGGFKLKIDVMRNILEAEGNLTTTINGKVYTQPGNGD